jgi:hypothetical protein
MERFTRLYSYIEEYQNLLYDVYSKTHTAYLLTYYNIDSTATIWDNEFLMGGAYEKIGDFSGIIWKKILLMPVFFAEETTTQFDAQESGHIKENITSFVFPSSYNLVPKPSDIIKLEQSFLQPNDDRHPLFVITGVEKATNTSRTFYKVKCEIEQSRTTTELDIQVEDTYVFIEYFKRIYQIDDASFIVRLLYKNNLISEELNNIYDKSGLYFI